ncbi:MULTISPECIES: PadR family transcriptional regulator [Corynebacterium]|uniref:PadR family transcriptional regulator n=1 Tax=Corynebacterium TaxID=1716 RepID=UPI0008A570A5|nr:MULTISPECIES: PadR family transcriptional regulator [Corynebacterium]MCT1442194.1 PadR family transcriptional regulator [Corynebacterium glucuronolyticum]OFO48931.1 transcriptional regulator [Corynebacterium sp. HMSC073D01]
MSIPNALLSLLTEGPQAASQVQSTFQARTDNAWPLNIGQVTQTLGRLERDGLIESAGKQRLESGRLSITYEATATGKEAATTWMESPVDKPKTERDELTIKIALADPNEIDTIIFTQRAYVMEELRALTRGLAGATPVEKLVAKRRIFECEAELRFLDYVEETHA